MDPNLILSIDEGPKKGETFDCRPGSFIRIGRFVRGNTLAIKDPGISQKHLIIEFHPEMSQWAVTDLSTSNGTAVNGAVISPNTAFPLSDGNIIKIGADTLISIKFSAPEPRRRRGRRVAAAVCSPIEKEAKEEQVSEPAKLGGKRDSEGKACNESVVDVDDAVKPMPEKGKRRIPTRASAKSCSDRSPKVQEAVDVKENEEKPSKNYEVGCSRRKKRVVLTGASRNEKALEMVAEEDCRSASRAIELSARALKEKNEERDVGHEKVEVPTKNGVKGMGRPKSGVEPARVLRKYAPLAFLAVEQKRGSDVKALLGASSSRVLFKKDEEGKTLEQIEGLANDGRGGRARGKRGGGSRKVLWKDDVLEPMVVEGRKGRLTRASTMAMSSTAWVSKVQEGEDEEIKEEKVEEPANNKGKQRAKGKRGGRSSRISGKGKVLESVAIEEKVEESLSGALDVVVASSTRVPKNLQKKKMITSLDLNSVYLKGLEKNKSIVKNKASGDGKKLAASSEVRFRIEEVEINKAIMISGESNNTEDLHFPSKEELAYSWSSFSEIRGIPNTTSKYREDKMINCHATPFEARVERALNRVNAETSSSMET